MSVQSEITRIESAKTAIATAIEGKGVTVPEGTKLDGLAALVESIEAGGMPGFYTGSITVAEESVSVTIENAFTAWHSPRIILVYEENAAIYDDIADGVYYPKIIALRNSLADTTEATSSAPFAGYYVATYRSGNSNSIKSEVLNVSSVLGGSAATGKYVYNVIKGKYSSGELYVYCGGTYGLRAGKTYRWVTIVEDEL